MADTFKYYPGESLLIEPTIDETFALDAALLDLTIVDSFDFSTDWSVDVSGVEIDLGNLDGVSTGSALALAGDGYAFASISASASGSSGVSIGGSVSAGVGTDGSSSSFAFAEVSIEIF